MSNETQYTNHRAINNIVIRHFGGMMLLNADDHETNASFIRKCMEECRKNVKESSEKYKNNHPVQNSEDVEQMQQYEEELKTIDYNIKNIEKVNLRWGPYNIPYDEKKYIALYENIIYGGINNDHISNVHHIDTESVLYLNIKWRPQPERAGAAATDGKQRKKRKKRSDGHRKRHKSSSRKVSEKVRKSSKK